MTHSVTAETLQLLRAYFLARVPAAIAKAKCHGRRVSSKMQRRTRSARPQLELEMESDFRDPESQRVLGEAARVVARELGRQAGHEWFDKLVAQQA
jgi:hypothetical protein